MNDQYIVVPTVGVGFLAMLGQGFITVVIAGIVMLGVMYWLGRETEEKPPKEKTNQKEQKEGT